MVRDHNATPIGVPIHTMAPPDPLQSKTVARKSGNEFARRDRTAEHLLAADDHGRSRYDNGSVLRIVGDGIAGLDQILHVKLGGFADVGQRLFGRVSPGVAAFQGRQNAWYAGEPFSKRSSSMTTRNTWDCTISLSYRR